MEDEATKPSAAQAAAAPAGVDDEDAATPLATRLVRLSHASGGPTAGLVAKTQQLAARLRDTPGDTWHERLDTWYSAHSADATGVIWPAERVTKLWKFFFKAGAGTTDRYGFAIKMGPVDQRSEAERTEARARSAASLVNIDPQERTRRTRLGLGLASAMVVAAAVLLAWDAAAGGSSHLALKAGLFLPFMFGLLLAASGATGL